VKVTDSESKKLALKLLAARAALKMDTDADLAGGVSRVASTRGGGFKKKPGQVRVESSASGGGLKRAAKKKPAPASKGGNAMDTH
jgi:hypothetical protein